MLGNKKKFVSKQIKEDLENLERYIEELSVFLPLAIYTVNPNNVVVDINKAAQDISGYNEDLIIGKDVNILFKDKDLLREYFAETNEKEIIRNKETILITRKNKEIPINISISVRKDDQNEIVGYFLAVSDISEIKKFQRGLEKKVEERTSDLSKAKTALINMLEDAQESKERMEVEKNKTRAALTSITDGLIVLDRDKKITLVNPDAEKKLKIKEKDVLNKKIEDLTDYPNIGELYQALEKKIEWTGQKYELVLEKPLKRYFDIFIAPIAVDKNVIGMIIIMHDITRDREISRMKTEFVSIAAHQLRTPLSAIKWSLKMILDGDVGNITSEQIDFLEKTYQSNERMILLINDLLNVSRIEEGRFVYNQEPCSLEEIIEDTIEVSRSLGKKKKVKVIFEKPKKSLPKVRADKEKISIVIQNLVDNGIRFNKVGGNVTILTKHDNMFITVMVKDTGVGIPKIEQERIFTKFFRANNVQRLDVEGSGLGLFICKNIIEVHGGKIWFESEKNKGTSFIFTLPIDQ